MLQAQRPPLTHRCVPSVAWQLALFRHPNGTFFLLGSHQNGWAPNPLVLLRAQGTSLEKPDWVNVGNPTGSDTSFNSQPTAVVQARRAHADLRVTTPPNAHSLLRLLLLHKPAHAHAALGAGWRAWRGRLLLHVPRRQLDSRRAQDAPRRCGSCPRTPSNPTSLASLAWPSLTAVASARGPAASYVWLPLQWDEGGQLSLKQTATWELDDPDPTAY